MAVLNDCIYKNLARMLIKRIGRDEFFNGSIVFDSGEHRLILRATLLVYRNNPSPGARLKGSVRKILPVWYDCEITENGKVIANEFSWNEFREFLPLNEKYI